jgi:hypothetical protein
MDRKIEMKDTYLAGAKRKYEINSNKKENKIGKDIKDLDYINLPKKTTVLGPIGNTSVKEKMPRENPLRGGQARDFNI